MSQALVCSVGCMSAWLVIRRLWGPPLLGWQHSFVKIDHEIFSMVILSLLLIQEGQLSVSDKRMCTILVNCLEDKACPVIVWLGYLNVLIMTPMGWLGCKTSSNKQISLVSVKCDWVEYHVMCLGHDMSEWGHYEKTPIQIYRKFQLPKLKIFR